MADYSDLPPSQTSGTSYVTADHLGSTRFVTDTGGTAKKCYDYLPFREQIPSSIGGHSSLPCYAATDSVRQKFTGKERDAESGLDYFLARYHSGSQGRFTSPDPENAGTIPEDPQSWNGYAYARNNPLRYSDPDGLRYRVCDAEGSNCHDLTGPQP